MPEDLNARFIETLNSHGYGFQYAVLDDVRAFSERNDAWALIGEEFPISVRGKDGHIDFVLKHKAKDIFVVAECKRANPAVSNWCFAYSGIGKYGPKKHIYQSVACYWPATRFVTQSMPEWRSDVETFPSETMPFHIAFELKSGQKGDRDGSYCPTKGIEEACLQVFKGVNGIVNELCTNLRLEDGAKFIIVPVVFTTANLYVSDVDLLMTDKDTGEIEPAPTTLTPVTTLTYYYRQSPSLTHQLRYIYHRNRTSIPEIAAQKYSRTVDFVNSMAVQSYLEELAYRLD